MPKAAVTPTPDAAALAALANEIDELGALEKEFAPLRSKLARIEYLRAAIRARYAFEPALATFTADGARFVSQIGAKGSVTSINIAKLTKVIGLKAFALFASCTLKALDENVDAATVKTVVSVAPTGPRSIKTFERGNVA
jgi:hypothetical protein